MAETMISRLRSIRRNGRGITLVELIVVLVILGILASAGIGASVGYAKRAIIEQNQSNAETIYQAAQTALQQLNKAGGIQSSKKGGIATEDEWVGYIISIGDPYAFVQSNLSPDMEANKSKLAARYKASAFTGFETSNPSPNESVHMRYVLTYSKSSANSEQSKLIKDLIQPYFADSTVFQGTITIEFDVEKSADAYGGIHRSAKCLSVFYDGRAKNGWPTRAYEGDSTVPSRRTAYRNKKSYIGYYDGYKGAAVDTVYLPQVQEGIVVKKFTADYEAVYPEVAPTGDPDPDPATTVTPTPEPLPVIHTRLIWTGTLDREDLVGAQKDVYYRIVLKSASGVEKVLILNEDFLLEGDQINGSPHSVNYRTEFEKNTLKINGYDVVTDSYTAVYPDNLTATVTRKSIEVMAKVYVSSDVNDGTGSTDNDTYRKKNKDQIIPKLMPLRISYVSGKLDYKDADNHPVKDPYIEYSLDLTGEGEANVFTNTMTEAILTVYPNYFKDPVMAGVNDKKGIIPFKKGISAVIDQEKAAQPTPQVTPP